MVSEDITALTEDMLAVMEAMESEPVSEDMEAITEDM